MNDRILYRDERVTITYRQFVSAEHTIPLARVQNVRVLRLLDTAHMRKAFLRMWAWGLCCLLLAFTPLPNGLAWLATLFGIWQIEGRAWPYAVVVETHAGEHTLLQSHDRAYAEKIARLLCKRLGLAPPRVESKIRR